MKTFFVSTDCIAVCLMAKPPKTGTFLPEPAGIVFTAFLSSDKQ
jgi:hypothetical protein